MEEIRPEDDPQVQSEKTFLKDNFGLSEEAALATAEDRVLGVAPAESSHEVELDRIAKAQATENDGKASN